MADSRLPSILRAFRHRNYRLFFGGQLISLVGTWMQMMAQSWLVYRLTMHSRHAPLYLGLATFAGQIPVFLLSIIGGEAADRFPRRSLLVATQSAAMLLAFVLAGLTLTGLVAVWQIFLLSALLGVVNAFDVPTRQAFVAEMVGREDLVNAIALNSSMFNGARILGPAVAGLLVAAIGEGWCFFANGVSYLAVIGGLLLMRVAPSAPRRKRSTIENIREGLGFVAHTPPVRALLLLLGLVSVVGMPYAVLMPIFADRVLTSGAESVAAALNLSDPRALRYGILLGSSGIGALLGALALASRKGVHGLGRWVAVAAAAFGATLILFAVSRTFWLSAVLLLPVGFSMIVEMASSNTLIQSMTPDALRGRVMSVYSMMFLGMAPFGALLAGAAAGRMGAPATIVSCGAVCLAGSAVFAARLPALAREGRRLILAQEEVGGVPSAGAIGPLDVPEGDR